MRSAIMCCRRRSPSSTVACPVLAGIIDMETMRVVDQAKRAAGFGVDALVATAPFYALGGPKG